MRFAKNKSFNVGCPEGLRYVREVLGGSNIKINNLLGKKGLLKLKVGKISEYRVWQNIFWTIDSAWNCAQNFGALRRSKFFDHKKSRGPKGSGIGGNTKKNQKLLGKKVCLLETNLGHVRKLTENWQRQWQKAYVWILPGMTQKLFPSI